MKIYQFKLVLMINIQEEQKIHLERLKLDMLVDVKEGAELNVGINE